MSQITQAAFVEAHSRGDAQVVDVRETREFTSGHVPGARSVPMAQLTGRLHELDPTRPVYVICASGSRSSAMADVLAHHGFDARSVVGGTQAWKAAGRPMALGPERSVRRQPAAPGPWPRTTSREAGRCGC
ncbi:MAG: rhodanese-like protein [Friedmanniella sp.]|nr:rhodanese-like protein [Friedmanniella sp.]